jgi:hypothetical protein
VKNSEQRRENPFEGQQQLKEQLNHQQLKEQLNYQQLNHHHQQELIHHQPCSETNSLSLQLIIQPGNGKGIQATDGTTRSQ